MAALDDVWGEVPVWEPGRRLTHSFTLALDPDLPTEVSVEFVDTVPACRMEFTHGGWLEGMEVARARFEDWPVLLHRMALLTGA